MPAPWLHQLLDDAAVLPPRGELLARALAAHAPLRRGDHAEAVGGFTVTDRDFPHLRTGDLPLHLRLAGGAGMLEAALRSLPGAAVAVRRVEVALRDEADLAHNARRVVQVLDGAEPSVVDPLAVHVGVPVPPDAPSAGWLAALDELAARELGLLLPLGDGVSATGTAVAVEAALDRELPITFRGAGPDDALTALRAVRTALDGDGVEAVAAALADPAGAAGWVRSDPAVAARTRRWCVSVSVPDLPAALSHLASRGLLDEPAT
ncbi:hypothetical protein SAMN04488570_0181 [Nocardioides scoriae]|uniref:Uncharacterized protein n=1 Tax=Nocardioides scoriae TaxID=642780 RepID=A0A1H1LG80_9ACTN|nr:hypothetical protein [Nocardioides scoriae]SDR72869.1 hypothetical protein SAMN04488570_0181 [Nocardioides scoriae]